MRDHFVAKIAENAGTKVFTRLAPVSPMLPKPKPAGKDGGMSWAALNAAGRGPPAADGAARATEEARDAENAARYEQALRLQRQREVRFVAFSAFLPLSDERRLTTGGAGQAARAKDIYARLLQVRGR